MRGQLLIVAVYCWLLLYVVDCCCCWWWFCWFLLKATGGHPGADWTAVLKLGVFLAHYAGSNPGIFNEARTCMMNHHDGRTWTDMLWYASHCFADFRFLSQSLRAFIWCHLGAAKEKTGELDGVLWTRPLQMQSPNGVCIIQARSASLCLHCLARYG